MRELTQMIPTKPNAQEFVQALACVACTFLAMRLTDGLEGTEFSGGWLTGPLLSMANIGGILFIFALVLTFIFPRPAGAIGIASSLLCIPLCCYLVAPVPFAQVFARGHEFKIQRAAGFHFYVRPTTALIVLTLTICICLRRLLTVGKASRSQLA